MSAIWIILASLPSFCQKLWKLGEIWRSSDKNNFAQFFWDTVLQYWLWCLCAFSSVRQCNVNSVWYDCIHSFTRVVCCSALCVSEAMNAGWMLAAHQLVATDAEHISRVWAAQSQRMTDPVIRCRYDCFISHFKYTCSFGSIFDRFCQFVWFRMLLIYVLFV